MDAAQAANNRGGAQLVNNEAARASSQRKVNRLIIGTPRDSRRATAKDAANPRSKDIATADRDS